MRGEIGNKNRDGFRSVALERRDFDVLAEAGAAMVWSPLSNLLLYGKTANVAAAKAAGVRIALGPDWSPSGSKNVLGELKVAHLQAQADGVPLSDFELQLELTDSPEARQLKKQLRGMNPQQRAQALRMLENQAAEAQRTGITPPAMSQGAMRPRVSGRPMTRPPRASRKRRKR